MPGVNLSAIPLTNSGSIAIPPSPVTPPPFETRVQLELGEYVHQQALLLKERGIAVHEISQIFTCIKLAAKVVNKMITKLGAFGLDEAHCKKTSATEDIADLARIANKRFLEALMNREAVAGIATTHSDTIIPVQKCSEKNLVVLIHPMDGTKQIDVNVSSGTIFSVYKRVTRPGTPVQLEDFLQCGKDQSDDGAVSELMRSALRPSGAGDLRRNKDVLMQPAFVVLVLLLWVLSRCRSFYYYSRGAAAVASLGGWRGRSCYGRCWCSCCIWRFQTVVVAAACVQICAGYVLYGSSTIMVITLGAGVHGFTLDPSLGSFFLSHMNVRIPETGNIYSVNGGKIKKFPYGVRAYIAYCQSKAISCRYIGSLVADFHRNMLKGGIYIYPPTYTDPIPSVSMIFQCFPLAFLAEQAGGKASDGFTRLLLIEPISLLDRVAFFCGSAHMVDGAEALMARYKIRDGSWRIPDKKEDKKEEYVDK